MTKASNLTRALLLAAAMPAIARAAPLDMKSAPVAVTVYTDQATVTRQGEIDVPAGDSELMLHNIPLAALRDTVTATAKATSAVTLGAVETRPETVDPAVAEQRRSDLVARIRALGDQIAMIDTRAAGFGNVSVELDAIPPDVLREMVREVLSRHIDDELLEELQAEEGEERAQLKDWVDSAITGEKPEYAWSKAYDVAFPIEGGEVVDAADHPLPEATL